MTTSPVGERRLGRLVILFGLLAFLQGVAEPTEGLVAQPVRALWAGRGTGAGRVAGYAALAALPWALKPLLGLLVGLFVATLAIADVATDAWIVDQGRIDGRTGRYQSATWFCLFASGVATGFGGGALSATRGWRGRPGSRRRRRRWSA